MQIHIGQTGNTKTRRDKRWDEKIHSWIKVATSDNEFDRDMMEAALIAILR